MKEGKTILAFLQNQWFKKPNEVRAVFERHAGKRNELVKRFLFNGCKSGKVLQEALGRELCEQIIWEESSKEITGYASGVVKPDPQHMLDAIKQHNPDIILVFGAIARHGITQVQKMFPLSLPIYFAPHPTSRDYSELQFKTLRQTVVALLRNIQNA